MDRDAGYRPFAPPDAGALAFLMRQSFGFGAERVEELRALFGDDVFRVLERAGQPVASLAAWTVLQYFGGRPLPCRAIAALAVDPGRRSGGLGGALLASALAEAREGDAALAVLYAATLPLYAKLGFGRAGTAITYRANPRLLAEPGKASGLVRMDPLDADRLAEMRRRQAQGDNGLIERTEAGWTLVLKPGGEEPVDVFLVPGADGPEGYIAVKAPSDGRLVLADACVLSRRAGRRILAFLAGTRAQIDQVEWFGGPEDPLVHLAAEAGVEIGDWDEWLLRVLDVRAALSLRGYPLGLEAELTLDVADPVFNANHGRFRLRVAEGRGVAERIGPDGDGDGEAGADLRLPIEALAPLFTGHLSAATLRRMGALTANNRAVNLADMLFSGPRPWLAERF